MSHPLTSSCACVLCGGKSLQALGTLDPAGITAVYASMYGIDLRAVQQDHPTRPLAMLRCQACDLRQFAPEWIGSPGLYEALQEFPWYYQASKYEFEATKGLVKAGDTVLEVGCATGNFRQHLPADISYRGLEFNQKAIDAACQRGLDVSATPLEAIAIQHPASHDAVFAFQVLEHVPDPRAFLLSMLAATKPGGLVVFSVPNEDSFLHHEVNNVTNLPPHHATRWSDATFERLGSTVGAQRVAVSYEPLTPGHRSAWANAQVWRLVGSVLPIGRNGLAPWASKRWARGLLALVGLPFRCWAALWPKPVRGHTVVVTLRKALDGVAAPASPARPVPHSR
jgi:SAM-dependent methyltransferase